MSSKYVYFKELVFDRQSGLCPYGLPLTSNETMTSLLEKKEVQEKNVAECFSKQMMAC